MPTHIAWHTELSSHCMKRDYTRCGLTSGDLSFMIFVHFVLVRIVAKPTDALEISEWWTLMQTFFFFLCIFVVRRVAHTTVFASVYICQSATIPAPFFADARIVQKKANHSQKLTSEFYLNFFVVTECIGSGARHCVNISRQKCHRWDYCSSAAACLCWAQ